MPSPSVSALLASLVDYAGLYPPAGLPMAQAVDNYATYLRSEDSWMLGRFVCPVSRLEEFRRESRRLLPRTEIVDEHADLQAWEAPWRLTALIDGDLDENIDAVFAFNHEHQQPAAGLANIDAIELKAAVPADIDAALDTIPEEVFPFFEIPFSTPGVDARGFLAALSGSDGAAKIRTGGLKPEAIPSCESIAAFMAAAAAADVPFKATAGLHHPLRAERPLTYEAGAPRGVMHGFLNVFFAAAAAKIRRAPVETLVSILRADKIDSFRFVDAGVEAFGLRLSTEELTAARESFATSFGSCSFDEPVQDLRELKLI